MKLARVCGTVVSTIHHPVIEGEKLLLVELLGIDGRGTGRELIAVDRVGAGAAEIVIVLDEGNGARQVLDDPDAPIRTVVVGVVDEAELDELLLDGRG